MEHPLDLLKDWAEALLAERDEERMRLKEVLEGTSIKVRRSEGLTWSPVEVDSAAYAFGGALWSLRCSEGGGQPGIFRVGSAVLLTPLGPSEDVKEWGTWPARVAKMRGLEMEVVLEGDGPEGVAIQHVRWTVDARPDEKSYQAMAHALSHWVNVDDVESKAYRDLVLGVGPWFNSENQIPINSASAEGINDMQRRAVQLMCAEHPLTLLHGPPGTGKTRTLTSAVAAMIQSGDRVLATAPSNMAVDVLVERFQDNGLRAVRLGHPMRVQDSVMSRTIDALVRDHPDYPRVVKTRHLADQNQREADRFIRNFGDEQRDARRIARGEARLLRKEADDLEAYIAETILREADVVCATLVGCDDRRLRAMNFDVVVVDEAAQALPPATMIAMRRAPRIVLCGDPCQLPPTVKSRRGKILETTLLQRGISAYPNQALMLEVQHRMHHAIMSAGNERFYDGKLRAHEAVATEELQGIKPWFWVDTAGCGFEEKRSHEGGERIQR